MRHILTRAAGSQENAEIHLRHCGLKDGDVLLLASDGLHGCLTDDEIGAILVAANEPTAAARRLLDAASRAGAPDNVSIIVVCFSARTAA